MAEKTARGQNPEGAELAEVADAIRFLIGDHASYITGAVLDVNGGLH